ncbi:MAG: HAMP domain-containing protein [Clostridia bacterium]|nr:HAMP domain-containing protein [Clostridia bacterium]
MVLLITCNAVLVLAYTYFGKRTYVELERKSLNQTADSLQSLFSFPNDQELPKTSLQGYLDVISTSKEVSYVLVLPGIGENVYTNMDVLPTDEHLRTLFDRLSNGESVELDDFEISEKRSAICVGRPLYVNKTTYIGSFILIKEINQINHAFARLSRSLWLVSLLLLPLLILTSYFAVNQMLHPITEMTKVAKQLSKGNYDVRAKDDYPGELGLFARTLNNMSRALSTTIHQLENEKRQLGYILSSFSDGVAAINSQGELTHYNPALMKMFGTVDVHSTMDLVPDRSIWEAFEGVVDSQEPRMFHYNLPGDRVLWISVVPVLSDSEGCVGAVGLFKDATEIEKLERMRNEYVANISHELRTPLTSLRGLLEPLADGMVKDPEKQKQYYSIMLHEVERLSRLITDMLQLSRLQAGTEAMEMTMFDVNELLEEVSQSFQTEAKKRNIRIELETAETLSPVLSDRDRIEQVLVILIDNALRYAKSKICLRASENVHEVVIDVWDDGIGISKENLSRVFERFYKVDKSRKDGGTGLGLSIAKKIMDQLEEQIEVDSKEGEWTCFRFTLKKYVSNAIPLSSVPDIIVSPEDQKPNA